MTLWLSEMKWPDLSFPKPPYHVFRGGKGEFSFPSWHHNSSFYLWFEIWVWVLCCKILILLISLETWFWFFQDVNMTGGLIRQKQYSLTLEK
jgi:hypothetical protein